VILAISERKVLLMLVLMIQQNIIEANNEKTCQKLQK
jgi:hypothetical protein